MMDENNTQSAFCLRSDTMAFRPISWLGNAISRLIPARYIFAILGAISFAILYGLKVNLSVAIVVMVNHTSQQTDSSDIIASYCPKTDSDSSTEDGPFKWDESLQGLILSSYYWGYLISQLPAARISEKFSAKWVLFTAVVLNIISTLLTPVAAESEHALMFLRCVEGIGGGFSFPAMHVMLSKWAPVEERTVLSSIAYAGAALGTVLSLLFAGLIAKWQSWEAVFYWMGGLAVVWCILWVWLVEDDSIKQRYITDKERKLIQNSLGDTSESHKTPPVPWKKIWTSVPFLVILVSHVCNNFCWYILLTELPKYMKQVLYFDMEQNSLISSIPYLTLWLFSTVLSKCLDIGRTKKFISTTIARKIATFFASIVPAACLLAVARAGCESTDVIVAMSVAITAMGGMYSGVLTNHIDIASNYAGTLIGITNTIATVPGIIVPIVIGEVTHTNQTPEQWGIIFYTIMGILLFEAVIYLFFGSGEEQSWNKLDDRPSDPDISSEPELTKEQQCA
ncbi:sialin [Periplaneta americana]|uniref:sialin n=1 Tax=Periplaneta americana TaxID=6978 RepID=UPI0037E91F07